jgi:16S rRNA (guanine1207-N2)-methyltransferase
MSNNGRMASSAAAREALVAEALLLGWGDLAPAAGPALVCGDRTDRVRATARATGWHRVAHGPFAASAIPAPCADPAGYAMAALRLDRDRAGRDFALHQVAAALAPGGELWLYGANDEGAKSPGETLLALFENVETVAARRHCRVWRAQLKADAAPLAGLDPWWRTVADADTWFTLPGVFAKGGVDEASEFLLEALTGPEGKPGVALATDEPLKLLDFGCGAGILCAGLLSSVRRKLDLDALDADALATATTQRNVPEANVYLGDGFGAVPGKRYHRIISNPPIHAGKSEDFAVLRTLVADAPEHLLPGGDLWIVVQRQVPVHPLLEARYGQVKLVSETPRFRVWRASAPA